jgi:cytosine/adenosine deaminase-related metal-dependent hydrolase
MQDVGCLAEGAWGDLTVVGVPVPADRPVEEAVLGAGPASVRVTFLGGREVWRRA